jgi:hypothetical protein
VKATKKSDGGAGPRLKTNAERVASDERSTRSGGGPSTGVVAKRVKDTKKAKPPVSNPSDDKSKGPDKGTVPK